MKHSEMLGTLRIATRNPLNRRASFRHGGP
jgi:hypothetical protein